MAFDKFAYHVCIILVLLLVTCSPFRATFTERAGGKGIRMPICTSLSTPFLFEPTELDFRVCIGYDHSSRVTESQGHRLRSRLF